MTNRKQLLAGFAAAAIALSSASPALAQKYIAKQDRSTVTYQIAYESPAACDDETAAGFSAWNTAGSRFNYVEDMANYWYGYRAPNSPNTQVTFQPPSSMQMGATAEVAWGASVGSWVTPAGNTVAVVNDGDIIVNSDRWASRTFDCDAAATASNQFDFARIIAHEAGHVLGLGDLYDTASLNCALYGNGRYGVSGTQLCQSDVTGVTRIYGAR